MTGIKPGFEEVPEYDEEDDIDVVVKKGCAGVVVLFFLFLGLLCAGAIRLLA